MRFIETFFKNVIKSGRLLVYLNDSLIATETIEDNLKIKESVLIACNNNLFELREDKYFFTPVKDNIWAMWLIRME